MVYLQDAKQTMKTIELKDILAISGKGGLFKFIAQARNGIVVESLDEGKRHVAPATARLSSLDDIAIFTKEEELPLSDVFMKIHDKADGGETLSHKASANELKAEFEILIPDYDEDRVYVSDIKKVFQWYNQLHKHQMLEIVEKKEEGEEPEAVSDNPEAGSDNPEAGSDKPEAGSDKPEPEEA